MKPKLNGIKLEVLRDIVNRKLVGADYHKTEDNHGKKISAKVYISLEQRSYIKLAPLKKSYAGIEDKAITEITKKN